VTTIQQTAHDFAFNGIDGRPMPLAQFKGKVLLVVNTASECGYTPQYEGLEALWRGHRDHGLVVIGAPCNDFGGQEPGPEDEIARFCAVNYGVSFPLTAKIAVKGKDAHPFYVWAGEKAGPAGQPKWNFHKYLIGRDGAFLGWFSTQAKPTGPKITSAIASALRR
jgi:glutathione peroxidase